MITNTNAYVELKRNHQNDADFLVLICHAVPALNAYIKAVEMKTALKLPDPDHFQKPQPSARLKGLMPRYRKVAGRIMFLASFSYFEAYISDLIEEIIAFHAGVDSWLKVVRERTADKIKSAPILTRKLRESPKRDYGMRYKSAINQLSTDPTFRFPSELLAGYGIYKLSQLSNDMKASNIPEIVTHALAMPIETDCWDKFTDLREKRNQIAHGRLKDMDLKVALEAGDFLFQLAKKIDKHSVEHFLVIESVKEDGKAGIEPAPKA